MATINPYQRYSQKENVVTNNVLLMLSNLYSIGPSLYENYVNALCEDNNVITVLPEFTQQSKGKKREIIDGLMLQKPWRIIIETKLQNLDSINKLVKYTDSFKPYETKVLFHLSTTSYSDPKVKKIEKLIAERQVDEDVKFFSITYSDLIEKLEALVEENPSLLSLKQLKEDFEEYCQFTGLLPSEHILRAMACGRSFDLNVKHQFYFDWAPRGYSSFNYLGIYKDKAVQYIGEVEKVIVANLVDDQLEIITPDPQDVTAEQKERLTIAIKDTIDNGWSIGEGHRFFLLKNFEETDFRKTSKGGIFRVRRFDLEKELEQVPATVREIAEALREKTWT